MEQMKRKVVLLSHGLGSEGIAAFSMNILRNIDRNKFDIHMVLAVDPDSKQFHEDEVCKLEIPLYKTSDLDGISKVFKHAFKLFKYLRREKPDVFHANMDLFNGFNIFVAWLAGVPTRICHSHITQSQYEENTGRHAIVYFYRNIMRKLLWHFSTVRCGCSEMAMDYLYCEKWRTDHSSFVIHNGIDLTAFMMKNVNESTDKTCIYTRGGNVRYLATVGRLSGQKNPLFLIDIMKDVCTRRDDIELLWAGTGEMEAIMRQKIVELKLERKIHLLGARKDIPEILRCADAFVFPSLFEGFGIVLIEAQAAGLPCIASDRVPRDADMGGCVFLNIDNGTAEWAETIIDMIDGKIEKKILLERLRQYDVSFMLEQLEELYAGKE